MPVNEPDPAAIAAERALSGYRGPPPPSTDADGRLRALTLGALARRQVLEPQALREALADPDPRVRRRACELAPAFGIEVAALLSDPDPVVGEAAAFACGETSDLSDEGLTQLVDLARSAPHPLVREAAVAALGSREDRRALPAILAALEDVVTVRRRAVIALAPFAGPAVLDALSRLTADRDWQVANAATDLLREKRDTPAGP